MNSILVGINAQYIHTALAVRSIAAYIRAHGGPEPAVCEFTINQPVDAVLSALYEKQPDVLLFSCYIWNWELVRRLVRNLRRLLPHCRIYLGGPQVSYHAPALLRALPEADGILCGEGERAVLALCAALAAGAALDHVPSLCWRDGPAIRENTAEPPLELAQLAFCYPDLERVSDHILYYESSRGCPYTCSYCLSGLDRAVRFKPLDIVFAELNRFLEAGVRQVKFVDRTFNCQKSHCDAIWRYLIEHDNGLSNFHFEITAELLDDAQLQLLRAARPGLFQFEIGVQSANAATLAAIHRQTRLERLYAVCRALKEGANIHLHLDLIAGLPLEDLEQFRRSFNAVFALQPNQLQLGFLKVLPGSALEADCARYGIVSRAEPPYEVLRTAALPPEALFLLKRTADMVERFYNAGAFKSSLTFLLSREPSAAAFFESLADGFAAHGWTHAPPARLALYDLLFQFAETRGIGDDAAMLRELLLFDLCSCSRPKKLPDCLTPEQRGGALYHERVRALYRAGGFARGSTQIEVFRVDVLDPLRPPRETAVLFDYATNTQSRLTLEPSPLNP